MTKNKNDISFFSMVDGILPKARIIKLKGFSKGNQDYNKAKTPVGKWRDSAQMNDSEINQWISQNGWIGAVIPENRIIVDVDDVTQGELVKDLLEAENIHHHCIKTPNGWQFIFEAKQAATKEIKQITKFFTQIGVVIDTRTTGAGYIVFPTENTKGRYITTRSLNQLDELPHFLRPIRNSDQVKDKNSNEKYVFPIPIEAVGSRNDTLYKFATHLRSWNVQAEEIAKSMELIYEYFLLDKTDFSFSELKALTQSAINWKPDPPSFQLNLETNDYPEENMIPLPFQVTNNALWKRKIIDGEEQLVMVSRMAPLIKKELSNVERNSVHYELTWKDRGREKREVVPASTISTKRELLVLADYGFPVNDLNYKDLINYFDKYLAFNQLEQSHMVERLGHIKGSFIHPLNSQGVEILPSDIGEKQLLEAFQRGGTAETWKKEVFERIKQHPKVLFLVLASFASVLLKDIKVSPFIIDLSGSTSQGKTTALQVSRSVWGGEGLINEWNATKVAIERKAGFLNSFPLYMDDTRKADERILQSVVYQFSGGRSKGRGSLKGSQKESTWNNVLISTGEVSLSDYASKAGGAAARVIPLIDEPFESADYEYFSDLYKAIEENQGIIGLEFLSKWQKEKDSLISEFYKFKDHYMGKAKGNEVLTRLSMYYAAVHFAGAVIKKLLEVEFDLKTLDRLFDEIARENKTLDKPKELLEQILNELDSSRKSIYYDYQPDWIKAIYHYNTLCLTPAFLKDVLGPEEKMIRREWLKKGYTVPQESRGKTVDTKLVKHNGQTFRVIVLDQKVFEEFNLDFTDEKR